MVQQKNFGNGLSDCFWRDSRDRIIGLMTAPTSGGVCEDKAIRNPDAIRQFDYEISLSGLLTAVTDNTANKIIPDQTAFYTYDHLNQLVEAETPQGRLQYNYDEIQNLIEKKGDVFDNRLVFDDFRYGEDGAGPHQMTSAGDMKFEYDEVGNMLEYNGYELDFDAFGRLVEARSENDILNYYYDFSGERRLIIKQENGEAPNITKFPIEGYKIENGSETWTLEVGGKPLYLFK